MKASWRPNLAWGMDLCHCRTGRHYRNWGRATVLILSMGLCKGGCRSSEVVTVLIQQGSGSDPPVLAQDFWPTNCNTRSPDWGPRVATARLAIGDSSQVNHQVGLPGFSARKWSTARFSHFRMAPKCQKGVFLLRVQHTAKN